MSSSQWKVTVRAPLIFAHGQVSCMRKTIEHAHAQLMVVIVAPPEHAGQAASDADDVKVPNTDFTTVLCTRMSSMATEFPRVQPHCPAPRRFQETARPAMETSRRALQKVGVRHCAGRPLGRVSYDRAKGSENGRGTFVPLHGLGDKRSCLYGERLSPFM